MEQYIVFRCPEVAAVLIAGAQRFQAALLIEPLTDGEPLSPVQQAPFIERIWPTIRSKQKLSFPWSYNEISSIIHASAENLRCVQGKAQSRDQGLCSYMHKSLVLFMQMQT